MIRIPDNILRCAAAGLAAGLAGACSSVPVKLECRELEARLEYGDLSADQRRFATEELEACRLRLKAAEENDSAAVEGVERRMTPSDSQ